MPTQEAQEPRSRTQAPAACASPADLQRLHAACRGLINRYGFNSQGVDAVQKNLQDFREQQAAELLRLQRQHQEAQQQADSGAELQVSTRSGCMSAGWR